MQQDDKIRIDKYLWAIRIFKTRTVASDACKGGKVKKDGVSLKPSYEVKIGDTYHIHKGVERKVIKVLSIIDKRVDAPKAVLNYADLSPAPIDVKMATNFVRDPGTGRPTKRDRRDLDDLLDYFGDAKIGDGI